MSCFFAVPSEAAVGEHLHLKVSFCQPDAFSALTNWTMHSERGKIKVYYCANMACGADVIYFLIVKVSGGYKYCYLNLPF